MNLSLPGWLRSPDASLEELEAQLVSAKAAAQQAAQAVSEAVTAYDAEPSAKSETKLHEARQAAASASERVARAERLLGPARAKAAEIERQRLREERDRLHAEIQSLDREADELVREERDAWLAIVEARAARHALEARTRRVCGEHGAASAQLDLPAVHTIDHRRWPTGALVGRALMQTLTRGESDRFVSDSGERSIVAALARGAEHT